MKTPENKGRTTRDADRIDIDAHRALLEVRRRLLISEVNAISRALGLPGVKVEGKRI